MLPDRLRDALLTFRRDREWEQFHSPKNLAIALSVEAAELLEAFQWTVGDDRLPYSETRLAQIREELGDLTILLTYLAHDLGIDLEQAVLAKLALNAERYPLAVSKGNAVKYSARSSPGTSSDPVPAFVRYLGVDYSGAETPTASLKGLRIYESLDGMEPVEVERPVGPKKYWTRRELAEWLVDELASGPPAIVGIDHGFSFPLDYFERFGVPREWDRFLDDFVSHWPTHEDHVYVDFVRDGAAGNGAARMGDTKWRRLTERKSRAAKSVFHFDVQGSVAKSTHSGIPWLRYIRRSLGEKVHFWPFDGWQVPSGRHLIVEVYPRLWSQRYARSARTADQHDAYAVAAALAAADRDGRLHEWFNPVLSDTERRTAEVEGWILGVV